MTANILTQEQLKKRLHYNPDSGIFTWRIGFSNAIKAGDIAGSKSKRGYIIIMVGQQTYSAHRLAFLYMEGELPPNMVDHINRVECDNRWCNLRHATSFENQRNRKDNNKFIGVSWNKRNRKWASASATHNSKTKHLGVFNTHLCACYCRWAYDIGVHNNVER